MGGAPQECGAPHTHPPGLPSKGELPFGAPSLGRMRECRPTPSTGRMKHTKWTGTAQCRTEHKQSRRFPLPPSVDTLTVTAFSPSLPPSTPSHTLSLPADTSPPAPPMTHPVFSPSAERYDNAPPPRPPPFPPSCHYYRASPSPTVPPSTRQADDPPLGTKT